MGLQKALESKNKLLGDNLENLGRFLLRLTMERRKTSDVNLTIVRVQYPLFMVQYLLYWVQYPLCRVQYLLYKSTISPIKSTISPL